MEVKYLPMLTFYFVIHCRLEKPMELYVAIYSFFMCEGGGVIMDMYSQWGNLHLMTVPERSNGFDPLEMLTGVNNSDERSESRL